MKFMIEFAVNDFYRSLGMVAAILLGMQLIILVYMAAMARRIRHVTHTMWAINKGVAKYITKENGDAAS